MSDTFGRPLKGFDSLQGIERARVPRPPRMQTFSVRTTGPRYLRLGQEIRTGYGPGDPPPGFLGQQTTLPEWWFYWALAKIFNDPPDPRKYPFWGGRTWHYQKTLNGGANSKGATALDFLCFERPSEGGSPVGFRIQTELFHVMAPPRQKFYDTVQREILNKSVRVVDIYPQDYLFDPSGAAVIAVAKEGLGLAERTNPISGGTGRRVKAAT